MINLKKNPELSKIFDQYINTNTYIDYKVNQDIHKYFNPGYEDKDQTSLKDKTNLKEQTNLLLPDEKLNINLNISL